MTENHDTSIDLLVTGKYLLTGDTDNTILENGAVAVRDDTIVETGNTAALRQKYPQAEILASPHGLIMPGLINGHTHAAMACFRGLADDLPLMEWLQNHIFPVEAKLTADMVYHSTLLSIAEMIRSGTTSFCDMYLFAKEVARATADTGMRAWIGEVLYDFPSPNYGPLDAGFAYVEEMFSEYDDHPLIAITVDPHAIYTCAPELLVRLKEMADQHAALYVIHLAETRDEVNAAQQQFGRTPVRHLDALGLLDQRVMAAHGVVLEEDEIELLAKRGVSVIHCPESNMKLASGVAPLARLLRAGVAVGLGTDGSASNNDVDLFGEMNTVAKLHKVHGLDPTTINARTTVNLATAGGAAALGATAIIGSLETGKKADLIVLDLNQPHLTPLYNVPSHLAYCVKGSDVIHSVINGRMVMRDRQLLTLDEAAVLRQMNDMAVFVRAQRKNG